MHHTQICLGLNTHLFEYSIACLLIIFGLLPGLMSVASLRHAGCIIDKYVILNMNCRSLTTMYERDIRNCTVVMSHEADKIICHAVL